jgi:hypothetical protein
MIDSYAVAGWIAQLAFWVLLSLGVFFGELSRRAAIVFLVLWVVGYVGLPRLSPESGFAVMPYTAALDIVLVWFVFKADVRLS